MNIIHLTKVAIEAAKTATTLTALFKKDTKVVSSLDKDIKTTADIELNDCIVKLLEPTGIPIISEEQNNETLLASETYWIVDPLDGTYNFTRKFPFAAVSIALWSKGSPLLGVVHNVFNWDLFIGSIESPTTLNGKKLNVSIVENNSEAILSTGFPSGGSYDTNDLISIVSNVQHFKKIRTVGSAALMLSYVANGVFDVYYEKGIYLWDVAAGLCLVKQAGGAFLIKPSNEPFKYEVLASNSKIFKNAIDKLMR